MDINELENKIQEDLDGSLILPGVDHVAVVEIFTDEFIAEHTEYSSLRSLLEAYGPTVADGEALGPMFDDFIQSHSEFGSWNNMRQQAEVRYMEEHLA